MEDMFYNPIIQPCYKKRFISDGVKQVIVGRYFTTISEGLSSLNNSDIRLAHNITSRPKVR